MSMEQKINKWHLSEYNIFSSKKNNNKIPCINTLKRTYSELDFNDIKKLYDLSNIDNIEKELKDFINHGVIVNFDEKEYLKSMLLINSNKNSGVTIIIAPSLNCNFSCPYCFEDHSNKNVMNLETQNKVIDFIKNFLIFSWRNQIEIIWYGGEPLLYPEIIEYISNEIISFCQQRKIRYNSSILTNGYFFNQKNVDLLTRCKVNSVQITLDGLEENHNLTRYLKNGKGSFNQIIQNLKTVKYSGYINIRNDVHNQNKKDIEGLKELLKEIKEESGNNISYYIAPVIDVPAEESDNQVEFLNIQDSIEYEFKRNNENMPKLKNTYCTASSLYFFGIGSEGELYKCWEDFGFKDRIYGYIDNWDIRDPLKTANNPNMLMKYLNCAGFFDPECHECPWLPICGGGCPSKLFHWNMKCIPYVPYKFDIDFYIEKIREKINSNKENNNCQNCCQNCG